jgi:hypothetical protein
MKCARGRRGETVSPGRREFTVSWRGALVARFGARSTRDKPSRYVTIV